ncbi:MAG: DNA-protecting protein DprA [Elusimicrobia bacterium]|nr:DNA-protecting protein DprA [Elusimicrobiota bacterium]
MVTMIKNQINEKQAYILLNMIPQLTPRKLHALCAIFGSAHEVCHASINALINRAGVSEALAKAIVHSTHNAPAMVMHELELVERHGMQVFTPADPEYPSLLAQIPSPPPVLYVRGRLPCESMRAIALVGTRRPTQAGRVIARMISAELAKRSVVTVSGCARGIDSEVHHATCENQGQTVAVLGSGLLVPYPPENRSLIDRIAASGAVLSEFPLCAKPERYNFPRRNRIISGMSAGTVVVEAGIKSGALITARYALDQGREVMVVPGNPVHEAGQGVHWLLRNGARPVANAEEILEDVFNDFPVQQELSARGIPVACTDEERILLECMGSEHKHIDELIQQTGLPIRILHTVLMHLEMQGIIIELPGKYYMCSGLRSAS